MRVLMLAPGGIVHSERPLEWLLAADCDVIFMDRRRPHTELGRLTYVPTPRARGMRYLPRLVGNAIARRIAAWMVIPQLWRRWRSLRPDVVHVHWLDTRAYYAAKAHLRPLVLSVWGTDLNSHFADGSDSVSRRMVGEALGRADLVIVDAPGMAERCEALAERPVRVELLHLGVDTSLFRPLSRDVARAWRERLSIPADGKIVLSIRAWARNYNHHVVLDAFARARRLLPPETFLVFKKYNLASYPDAAAYEEEVSRRITKLDAEPWVRWIDEIPFGEVPEVYASADLIVNFPSTDTFPITFLEAAACERPVVTCSLPSYRSELVDGYFRKTPPGDVHALAEAIVEGLRVPTPPDRLAAARALVVEKFDERISAKRLLRIYEELVRTP